MLGILRTQALPMSQMSFSDFEVEHPFRVIKRQFVYMTTRFRGWPRIWRN